MTSPNGLPPRKCKLSECRLDFQPATSWQEFHQASCRRRWHWLEARKALKIVREQRIKV